MLTKADVHSRLSRHAHPQWLTDLSATEECTSVQRWGKHPFEAKVRRVKGVKAAADRGLSCSVFRKWSEETLEVQGDEVRADRRGHAGRKAKMSLATQPHLAKKYSKKLLTVECCYWNFLTPGCSTLHLWFWEILPKHCSIENHHFYALCAIIVSEAELRHQPWTPTIKFWCLTCFRSWMEIFCFFWVFFFFVMPETTVKTLDISKATYLQFPMQNNNNNNIYLQCQKLGLWKCVLFWNSN